MNQFSHLKIGNDGSGNALITYATPYGQSSIVLEHIAPAAVTPEWLVW